MCADRVRFFGRPLISLSFYMRGDYRFTYQLTFIPEFDCVKRVQIRSFFWSVFSCIRTEFGDWLRKSPYSVWIQENTDQKKLRIWTFFTQCSFVSSSTCLNFLLKKIMSVFLLKTYSIFGVWFFKRFDISWVWFFPGFTLGFGSSE